MRHRVPEDGDEQRLEELFRLHADAVMSFLRHRTDPETAKDVLTETFVVAWRRLDRVPDQPRGWLFAVARRVLANHVRSQGRAAALVERLAVEAKPDHGSAIDEALNRRDVLGALARLSERDREVLVLAGWYELSGSEAAQALGCSPGAYALRLHRARRRLRAVLEASAGPTSPSVPCSAWEVTP